MRIGEFTQVWVVDAEFTTQAACVKDVRCVVAREFYTGKTLRYWESELPEHCPLRWDRSALLVSYSAIAELSCFRRIGWGMPQHVLDLFCEFRCATNGLAGGQSLLDALRFYGLPTMAEHQKLSMRSLVQAKDQFTFQEQSDILNYCERDVLATSDLLERMGPALDIDRALLRGRFIKATELMHQYGIPIDHDTLANLQREWPDIQRALVKQIDTENVYKGVSFRAHQWEQFCERERIDWPRLESGKLDLKEKTFRSMSQTHEKIAAYHELRRSLSQLRPTKLFVASDGRHRYAPKPFASKTGRSQPSSNAFVFGSAAWIRSLIQPERGFAICYCDFEQQEFGIAAALSGDTNMQQAYASGDPYLAFAKQAGAVPEHATKETHRKERDRFKVCVLGVQYSMSAQSLAKQLGEGVAAAEQLISIHRKVYARYWEWLDEVENTALLTGHLRTVFGWRLSVNSNDNMRSVRNFPMQANGAEILRVTTIGCVEAGIRLCATVHDGFLIEAETTRIEATASLSKRIMVDASKSVLGGFGLRVESKIVCSPARYVDERGRTMWNLVTNLLHRRTSTGRTSATPV